MAKKIEQPVVRMSVTDAVLRLFDIGVTEKTKILATLMGTYPMLTLHTIDSILRTHRGQKLKKQQEEPPKPKGPIELAADEIHHICAQCPFHVTGRPCVLPFGICPHPDVWDKAQALDEMIKKQRRFVGKKKVAGGTIEYKHRAGKRPETQNIFELLEADLDSLYEEQELERETAMQAVHVPGTYTSNVVEEAVFTPDERLRIGLDMESDTTLEEFSDILSAKYNPNVPKDSFNFPIDTKESARLFDRYREMFVDANGSFPEEEPVDEKSDAALDNVTPDAENPDVKRRAFDYDNLDEDDAKEQSALDGMVYRPRSAADIYAQFDGSYDPEWENVIDAAIERTKEEQLASASTAEDFYTSAADLPKEKEEDVFLDELSMTLGNYEDISHRFSTMAYPVGDGYDEEDEDEPEEDEDTSPDSDAGDDADDVDDDDDFDDIDDDDLCLEDFSDILAPGLLPGNNK